jgi:hypothetical protein
MKASFGDEATAQSPAPMPAQIFVSVADAKQYKSIFVPDKKSSDALLSADEGRTCWLDLILNCKMHDLAALLGPFRVPLGMSKLIAPLR